MCFEGGEAWLEVGPWWYDLERFILVCSSPSLLAGCHAGSSFFSTMCVCLRTSRLQTEPTKTMSQIKFPFKSQVYIWCNVWHMNNEITGIYQSLKNEVDSSRIKIRSKVITTCAFSIADRCAHYPSDPYLPLGMSGVSLRSLCLRSHHGQAEFYSEPAVWPTGGKVWFKVCWVSPPYWMARAIKGQWQDRLSKRLLNLAVVGILALLGLFSSALSTGMNIIDHLGIVQVWSYISPNSAESLF